MKIPTLSQTQQYLNEAEARNPGPWIAHSINVAKAAQQIAQRIPDLDPESAYILGCLHDIGRREGITAMRHVLDGYTFLADQGYKDAAQIALTHSFPCQTPKEGFGKWDCSDEEYAFVERYLQTVEYTAYDRLLQLCDAIALPEGICLLEKRLVDVVLRHGVHDYVVPKWQKLIDIQHQFEEEIGSSIYHVLPGVIETTFGLSVVELTQKINKLNANE